MLPSRTLSVSIPRGWREVYGAVWRPQDFVRWASGLGRSGLERDGPDRWRAEGPEGPIRIHFTDHNAFGVMDHRVDLGGGEIRVPLRIVPNGTGAEVLFALFRQPGMSDERFAADAEWVERDLAASRALVAPA